MRVGCPIRRSRGQSLLAAHPGFSQRATSFIASWRQGIHRTPFFHSPSNHPAPARSTKPRTKQPSSQTASLTHTHTTTSQIHLSKNSPGGEHVSTGGVSWKQPGRRTTRSGAGQPDAWAAPRGAALAEHREKCAEPVVPASSHTGMAATRRHPPSASRHLP